MQQSFSKDLFGFAPLSLRYICEFLEPRFPMKRSKRGTLNDCGHKPRCSRREKIRQWSSVRLSYKQKLFILRCIQYLFLCVSCCCDILHARLLCSHSNRFTSTGSALSTSQKTRRPVAFRSSCRLVCDVNFWSLDNVKIILCVFGKASDAKCTQNTTLLFCCWIVGKTQNRSAES